MEKSTTLVPSGILYSIDFSDQGNRMAAAFESNLLIWKIPPENESDFFDHSFTDHTDGAEPLPKGSATDLPLLVNMDPIIKAGDMSVNQMANLLQFPLIIPTHLPEYISFAEAGKNQDGGIWLRYQLKNQSRSEVSLYILEQINWESRPPKMTIGEDALVTPLTINIDGETVTAEYVTGDWTVASGFSSQPGSINSGEMTNIWLWNDHSTSKRLRWQQYGILIAMYFRVENLYTPVLADVDRKNKVTLINNLLSQADMIQIARGMKWYMEVSDQNLMISLGQSAMDQQIDPYGSNLIGSLSTFHPNIITNGAMDIE
jgi:hypothetical protein